MSEKPSKYMTIPPSEFGPGSKFDFANNRLVGASGRIYEDVRISRRDFDSLCDDLGIPRKPARLQ